MHRALAPSILHVWLSHDAASAAVSSVGTPPPSTLADTVAGVNVTRGGGASVMRGGARSADFNVDGMLSVGEGGKEEASRACL
jgi:hypothetical protein